LPLGKLPAFPGDTPEEKPGHCIVDLIRYMATPIQKAADGKKKPPEEKRDIRVAS